ncbi:histone-lysine N-methyltransferase SETD2 isoform X2 [Scleropages formosus]|uniref:[histone H3]-lysine(36) N-trimethyltransferase n=1 Tax=Scleropages formosus TaxID=113540 RepID=A0A8C9QXX3_SCLFO|nr:histone-lysine N-methyltransferase SETD2 isoform X2 [Scleropages formosus]
MDTLVETEIREGGGDTVVKEESLSKPTLLKNLPTKGLLSSRLLPKGTKSKVNLEEHGRQKVSFSFSQTKKPLPNLFLSQLSPEKSPCDLQLPLLSSNNSQQGKLELKVESRNESTGLSFPTPVPESPLSVTSLPKSKLELGKMHFKKQLLSVSASFEKPVDEPKPTIKLEEVSSLQETVLKPATKITTEAAVSQIQLTFKDCISEEHVIGVLEENLNPSVKGSTDSSHIGTEIKEKFSGLEQADIPEQHKSQSQSDSTLPGSESDGDSVRTSSSHKSGDPRSMAKTDNQNKDAKRNFSRVEESEKLEKSSSYAKSDERVKEERCSTHSKSDRETRYSRSSRSDKERRRTKSRSRSRSRGSRTSSSYSRSERSSRNERLSRSDRSHYHDSERRSYRSPYRERRSSRSRSDRKSRDSSDSEDDYRRARTGSNRSSNHSSSHRDSKFFYSKSEKDVKCSEISRSSETEKRIQLHSRSERCPRKIEFESIRKTSPELESECRKSNAHCKLESNIKSPLSKSNICSQTIDKKPHKGHSSSDSEDDQKEKSKFIKLPPCSGLNDSQPAMSEKDFKVSLSKLIVTDAQVQDKLNNTELIQMQSHSNKYCPSSFEDGTQCQLNCLPSKHIDLSQSKDTAIPSKEMHHLSVPDPVSANDFVGQDCEEADSVNVTVSSGATLAPTYSLRSKSKPHKHNSSPPPKLLIVNTDSAQQCRSNQSLNKSSSVVCDTVLPDSCVSSETFTNEQDKEQLCKYGHTLPVVPVVLRKNETGVLSEPSRNSSPAVLSCQPYSKDNTSPGLSEESMMCVVSSERLSNLSGIEVLEGANVSSESNAHINDSIEVTNGFPSNRHVLQGHNSCEGEGHVESSIPVYRESIETKHYATAQLSSYSTCVLPDCSPPQISQKVCNPAEISIKELSLGDLQQKTKSEDICHGSLDETGSQSSVVPPKFESTKVSELSVASQQSEQLNIKTEQQSGTLLKNKINLKKSRWDIVGQDKSDHEHSLKMPCHETKPSVKKIISVKKIEFSKDSGLEHVKNFGTIKMNLNNETVLSKQHSVGKNHASLEDNSLKSPQNQLDAKTQLSMSTQSQPCDTSNTNVDICFDQNYKEPPRSSHATSRSVAKDWTRDSKTGGHDVLLDKLERRNTSINQDVGSHSDDSDSEESDSDSDDCSIPKNRLHSVVVVPKNSTLTQPHDSRATLTSFSSPTGSPHQLPADWQEQGWRGSSSKESNRAHDAYSEVSGTLSPVERQKGFSSQLPESSKHTLHVLCTERPILTGQQNVTYQSQSNMVDSTSHVEASHTFEAQQSKEQKSSTYQNPKISVPSSSVGSFHSFETMWRTSDPGQSRPCDRPDSWHDRKSILMHQQHGEFSSSDDLSNKDGYRWGWDIPQPEQPSSTFQQPDSSYGIHTPNPMLVGSPALGQMGQHSSGCWIQPTASQGCRPVYLSVPSLYRESLDEMHPDSLTNDYEEESQENHGTVTFCNHPPPASTSFVQGPEISSNCRGLGGVLDTPREDSQKPHRGRGPPKKRRPEFESDSENEAESENSIKRERLAEPDVSRTSKDPVDTPNQTAEVERPSLSLQDFQDPVRWKDMAKLKKMPPYFDLIEENMYLTERKKNKSHRDIKRMQCECAVLSREERARGATACGEDCLNRLLMIECSSRCLNGSYCSNRRFQMKQHADFEVILTENKGWGLRAAKDLAPNTFVLEYCGEVLDHKEFKARVKEYARSKNIHYYFMALKNNEIIDATLKGNCSRFMNHSCEPNCETQKWTVNGQLRVGFFTTKGVSAGTELTFDYQFQRYGKEAQKCLCGAPSCRGFLGGENRVSIRAAGGKMKKERSRKKDSVSALTTVDEELEALLENGEGLSDEKEVISLCRLMVRVETMEQKLTCLKLIQNTQNPGCLKQFLDHHGLSLLWIFMVELSEAKGNSSNNIKLQLEIMRSLEVLPISTKNMLEESRVLHFIQRWAQNQTLPQAPELDGYSSENTSRAQTPLNTPDGPPAKLGPELDGETPKRAVYRRLKIISENSLDSAMSDASKASDGKEEEEEEEEDEEEDSLPVDAVVSSHTKPSAQVEEEVSAPGLEKQEPAEVKEEAVETGQLDEERTKGQKGDVELAPDEERMEKDVGVEGAPGVTAPSESGQHSQNDETGPAPVKELSSPEVQEADTVASKGPAGSSEVAVLESVLEPDVGVSVCIAVETTVNTSTVMAETTESITTTQESAVEESAASTVENVGSVIATAETTTVGSASTTTEVPGSAVPTAEAAATASTTTATDPVAVGTPSQDEEEGVSDVESERSQEPPIRAVDISDMAARLLDSWKDLKEVYRIPKKSQVEKEPKERSRERDGPQSSRTPSGSRDRERDRERDRDRERERDRDLERTPRSTERRRRRSSHSPPLSAYERSSRRSDDRYEHPNSSKKKVRPKERNKLTTEERRKLFEQEVAQKEAQKQQQQQQQQQLQALPYEMLGYSPGPHGYMGYPPGYPIQTYVDPTNPNAGKVLLPTPSVEPLCAAGATVPYEQTPPQPLISELGLASPSSAPPSQTAPTAGVPHMATTLELAPGTAQYVQSRAPSQDSVTVLSAAPPTGGPQTQTQQGYTPVWSAAVPQPLTVQAQPAQPHTAIYYQGQACQAVYSIPTAYPQAGTPVIQTYAEPATGYIQGQPVYTAHQQGVVLQQAGTVTTIVTAPTVQQDLIAPNSLMDLPPPSPPKPKTIVLPPNWKVARDPEGKIYYYHVITRQTQWDPPCWEGGSDDASVGHEAEMDLGTPTYDENPSKFSTKTAEADTSSELAKKSKEVFRKEMSQFIVQCLNPYRKPDCKSGRISNTEDFKHLARKLTHGVMNKELKSCKNPEDLECNENVKHKTKEYIKKYMQKFGPVYRPKEDTEVD